MIISYGTCEDASGEECIQGGFCVGFPPGQRVVSPFANYAYTEQHFRYVL